MLNFSLTFVGKRTYIKVKSQIEVTSHLFEMKTSQVNEKSPLSGIWGQLYAKTHETKIPVNSRLNRINFFN